MISFKFTKKQFCCYFFKNVLNMFKTLVLNGYVLNVTTLHNNKHQISIKKITSSSLQSQLVCNKLNIASVYQLSKAIAVNSVHLFIINAKCCYTFRVSVQYPVILYDMKPRILLLNERLMLIYIISHQTSRNDTIEEI